MFAGEHVVMRTRTICDELGRLMIHELLYKFSQEKMTAFKMRWTKTKKKISKKYGFLYSNFQKYCVYVICYVICYHIPLAEPKGRQLKVISSDHEHKFKYDMLISV